MTAIVSLSSISVVRGDRPILRDVDWTVLDGERWVVLGPNGAGKTTLIEVASLYLYPSSGQVTILGAVHGRTDVRPLRGRIGYVGAALAGRLHPGSTALEAVATGGTGVLDAYWAAPGADDLANAARLLVALGCAGLEQREVGTLSEGERQRVQIARALMASPDLLLLDEPAAGLDIAGRAVLVRSLAGLAEVATVRAIAFVTHHVEEIPAGFGHVLLLRGGRVLAAGPIETTLTADALSACFGLPLGLDRRDGRWTAWAGAPASMARGVPDGRDAGPDREHLAGNAEARFVLDPDGRRKAYRPLPVAARRHALEAFIATYASRRYFDAHEILEPAWMGTDEPAERALHQGLIKVAAAGVHASRGNARGTIQNLEGALRRLRVATEAAAPPDVESAGAPPDGESATARRDPGALAVMLDLVDLEAVVDWVEGALALLSRRGSGADVARDATTLLAAAPAPVARTSPVAPPGAPPEGPR